MSAATSKLPPPKSESKSGLFGVSASGKKPKSKSGLFGVAASGKKPKSKSGLFGVTASGKKWRAELNYERKSHSLGALV